MTESSQEDPLLSLLTSLGHSNHEVVEQLKHLNTSVLEANRLARIALSLEKDRLREQMSVFFAGKAGPKRRLIELYLSIGNGKTRKELIDDGLPEGTVWRYCTELVRESLLQVKEVRADGEEVLGYTAVEELAQLSRCLEELIRTN